MSTSLQLRAVLTMALGLGCVHAYSDSGAAVEPWPYSRNGSVAENKILATLDQNTRLEFLETPLTEIFEFLSDFHGIPFVLDAVGLEEMSIDPATETVSMDLSNVTLRNGLIHLLRQKRLTYSIRNDVVLITAPNRRESLDLRAYNVKALVDQGVSPSELVTILQGVDGAPQSTDRTERGSASADGYRTPTRARRGTAKSADTGTFYLAANGDLMVVRAMDSQHREVARSIRTIYEALVQKQPAKRIQVATPTPRARRHRAAAAPKQSDDPFGDPFGQDDAKEGLFGGTSEPDDGTRGHNLDDPFGDFGQ